jgi:hypothetical protein
MKLKKYSVLLRYPDYAVGDWPNATFTSLVSAHSYDAALDVARNKAFRVINKHNTEDALVNDPDDMEVVCAVRGHHKFYIPL